MSLLQTDIDNSKNKILGEGENCSLQGTDNNKIIVITEE